MQNNFIKIYNFYIRTGTNYLLTTLNIMTAEDIHENKMLTFVNMYLMGKCPEISNQNYQVKTILYETREEGSLDRPLYRKEYGARSVKIVGAKLWNI